MRHQHECWRRFKGREMSFPRVSPYHTGSHTLTPTALSRGSTAFTGDRPPRRQWPRAGGEGACPGAALLKFCTCCLLLLGCELVSAPARSPHTGTQTSTKHWLPPAVSLWKPSLWAPRGASGSMCTAVAFPGHTVARHRGLSTARCFLSGTCSLSLQRSRFGETHNPPPPMGSASA